MNHNIKLNEDTSMHSGLVIEIQERLDEMVDSAWVVPHRNWINGALCAYGAWTDEHWELKHVRGSNDIRIPIYYVENEDGTERIVPSFLDF